MSLEISEQFYSIQGEGQTAGVPAVFLRLKGCNLTCGGKSTIKTGELDSGATWRCDTIETWTKGRTYSYSEICSFWENQNWLYFLKDGAHLIITGGEPLLYQKSICEFLEFLKHKYGFLPHIEIETNGTILPNHELISLVDYFNVSPKLANSGMDLDKRLIDDVLALFNSIDSAIFKFVVSGESDIFEIVRNYINPSLIDVKKIYLMPSAMTRDQMIELEPLVVKLCKKYSFNYSNRLHIHIWDTKKGV